MDTQKTALRKRWSCCALSLIGVAIPAFAVVLLVGWIILIHWIIPVPALVISEETTRITGPLTADGYIDFFKAMEELTHPPELATDENGYRVFVRLFGDLGERSQKYSEFYRLQKYEKLGLDPDIPPSLVLPTQPYTHLNDYYKAKGEANSFLQGVREPASRPWTLEEYPMFADWINEIDEPMDAIAEALRKPVFFFPMLQSKESVESGKPQCLFAFFPFEMQLSRIITRIFAARAGYRIGQGDIDGAIEDKITIHRLGRQITQSGSIRSYHVGTAIEGVAGAIPVGANPEHPLTEQQIRRILEGLDALPPKPPITVPIELDRYYSLSAIQSAQISDQQFLELLASPGLFGNSKNANFVLLMLDVWHQQLFNWNVIYQRVNEMHDAAKEPLPRARYNAIMDETREPGILELVYSLLVPGAKDILFANQFIGWFGTDSFGMNMDALEEVIHRAECTENIQRLALAVLLYRQEYGEMPVANWTEQIGQYLGENAAKYFSCPSNPAPEGKTTYALVRYADTVGGSLLLIELDSPVPLGKAVITVDEVIALAGTRTVELVERECCGRTFSSERITGTTSRFTAHPGGTNTVHRSGAVRYISQTIAKEELLLLLGREENNEGE